MRTADGMAAASDERRPGPAAGEQPQQQHVACRVFPERLAPGKPQQGFLSSFFSNNQKCQLMLLKTLQTSRSCPGGWGSGGGLSETRRAGPLGSVSGAARAGFCPSAQRLGRCGIMGAGVGGG